LALFIKEGPAMKQSQHTSPVSYRELHVGKREPEKRLVEVSVCPVAYFGCLDLVYSLFLGSIQAMKVHGKSR
jgi:hypothetical protein